MRRKERRIEGKVGSDSKEGKKRKTKKHKKFCKLLGKMLNKSTLDLWLGDHAML